MIQLFAQPYDISANGFFFQTVEEYQIKRNQCTNDYGQAVEEFEIQFIDGNDLDCEYFNALGVHQGNFHDFLDTCDEWEEYQKITVIIAVGECGYHFDLAAYEPDNFEIDIYKMDNMKELAYEFVEQGLFGEIPERIQCYLDFDAIACDLSIDYSEISIAGKNFVYRCC